MLSNTELLKLYCLATPFHIRYFYLTPFLDSLVVNDMCKYLITALNRHFVNSEIIKMPTIHESNYTVMKQARNGNSKAKKLTKNNSVYRSYQAHVIGWMHSIIFTQVIQP